MVSQELIEYGFANAEKAIGSSGTNGHTKEKIKLKLTNGFIRDMSHDASGEDTTN